MVVTAGPAQASVILKAKALGCEVLATDINTGAPGLALANCSAIVDASDQNELLRVASQFAPQAIVTEQTDAAVASVAFVAEQLDLPGIGYEAAVRATDKWHMREACRRAAVACRASGEPLRREWIAYECREGWWPVPG